MPTKPSKLADVELSFAQEWPPIPGKLFETSIMCWSYQDESFWRGKSISMAEVISYAKSMALPRFKEVRPPPPCASAWPGFNLCCFVKFKNAYPLQAISLCPNQVLTKKTTFF